MVRVKICGITNLEDALGAARAGAHALGFNFYSRSPRYIKPLYARRIIEKLPASVLTVGVFVNEDGPEEVAHMAEEAKVNAVQLHGDESPSYCRALKGLRVIKALRVAEDFVPESVLEYETEAILLDAFDNRGRGGTGRTFDWEIARRVRELVPKLYLAGGLSVENIAKAVEKVQPYAVDACSRLESAPGRKDLERVRAFVSAARVKP
ncbi:MAG: phosphoribosylanthranilate isomerase [Acidobacteria bacterium]|nr:phosphoribosylanthranilate isomerase [Acidobacteriota bacterium]